MCIELSLIAIIGIGIIYRCAMKCYQKHSTTDRCTEPQRLSHSLLAAMIQVVVPSLRNLMGHPHMSRISFDRYYLGLLAMASLLIDSRQMYGI